MQTCACEALLKKAREGKEERKKGRKEERKKGRKEERKKGRKEERKKGRKEALDNESPIQGLSMLICRINARSLASIGGGLPKIATSSANSSESQSGASG
jgi:hypothetical protein